MSDFDEEAEREKLRKRFAEEDEERETTERMSELLLQGATMTNTHCDTCGDPLFRYDGQTFCPTCQHTTDESGATADGSRTGDDEPTPERAMDDAQRIAVEDPDEQSADRTRMSDGERPEPIPTRGRRAPPSQTSGDASNADASSQPSASHIEESAGDLTATEASLSRTLAELANRAEKLDDLGRTREHLAAAREAAEALDAVRTARQTR